MEQVEYHPNIETKLKKTSRARTGAQAQHSPCLARLLKSFLLVQKTIISAETVTNGEEQNDHTSLPQVRK
jgi:hypothetical protein